VIDARTHISSTAANCPDTKMVLGGYSQGAAVIGYVTADAVPAGFTPPPGITGPMAPDVADHIASIVLFGKPSAELLSDYHAPPIVIGSRYVPKLLDLCAPGDPICAPDGNSGIAHTIYTINGMVGQGAGFAAQRVTAEPPKALGGQ
jgi:cutinase